MEYIYIALDTVQWQNLESMTLNLRALSSVIRPKFKPKRHFAVKFLIFVLTCIDCSNILVLIVLLFPLVHNF